ncbi:hypothetical protein BSL78_11311 [Apostichopus japonicus]|uniref:Transmembrane protein n=1 Tax=Stichopus japonicus TaxID=307972 RepID=A0A2G8KUV9_STIJA|nr:hypothetical protein BSL78_11311 [Apostichopus japonicus]
MKSIRLSTIYCYICVLCIVITVTSSMETNSTSPDLKVHKGLKREEKAAIWAALFGGIVFFVGLGIFVHGFFVRQYSDDYEYMNRIGTLQDEHRRPVAAK